MNPDNFYKEVLSYLEKKETPKGWKPKKVEQILDVTDIPPYDLPKFLKANKVPINCGWHQEDNGYDAATFETYVYWEVDVPYTKKEAYNKFISYMSRNMGSVMIRISKIYKIKSNYRKFDNTLGLKLYLKSQNDFIDYLDTFLV